MSTTDIRTCYFRYDPEADVAVLGFGGHPTAGGGVLEIVEGTRLPGLIRLTPDGQFKHLELLAASRSVPHLVSQLDVSATASQQMVDGTTEVSVTTAGDRSWVRIDVAAVSPGPGPEQEIRAMAPSGDLAAILTRQPRGPLHSLTLHATGRLIEPLLDPAGRA